MNPTPVPSVVRPPAKRLWLRGILLVLLLLLPVVIALEVVSCFHLSSDNKALRNSLIKSSGVEWRQKIALNAGGLTLSAVRAGLSFVKLDAGARAALQAQVLQQAQSQLGMDLQAVQTILERRATFACTVTGDVVPLVIKVVSAKTGATVNSCANTSCATCGIKV